MKLFLIDSDNLRRNLFEEVFGEEIYTLPSIEDTSFRIPDFNPSLVLVDFAVASKMSDKEVEELFATEIPCALVAYKEEGEGGRAHGWPASFLEKPIDFTGLKESVSKLYLQLNS